jgi:hypothetical protein
MITISFYSYKGGVGRSLALTNLGVYLAQFGATVVMVDFDLEAPGLHYKIRPGAPLGIDNRGLAGLLATASSGVPPAELDYNLVLDVSKHVETPEIIEEDLEQPRGRLLLVPAGDSVQPQYWNDLAHIDWTDLFSSSPRPGVAVMARLRQHLIDDYKPDFLLVDSRTGITPSGGVATTLLPDVVVMQLLNTDEHLDGSRMVISAIVQSGSSDRPSPTVLPVLSRYTPPSFTVQTSDTELRRRIGIPGNAGSDFELGEEKIPLHEIWTALVRDLDDDTASRVLEPLVLHADLALQQHEHLSFGPYSTEIAASTDDALLDDYLSLFANLVPREVVSRFLSGVRSRVRGIILDRPDDAVRTLENLAALVGDEAVFVDLVKVYVLRRDVRSMLLAAERLHKIHRRIIVHPAISIALREQLVRGSRVPGEPQDLRAAFLEDYWRIAAPQDIEWGAHVVRALAAKGLVKHATELAEELFAQTGDPFVLTQLVNVLAGGNTNSERLAAALAVRYFDLGASSPNFLSAAALACRYQPNRELAEKIVESPAFPTVPQLLAVDVLVAAGRNEDAGVLLVELLARAEPGDPTTERSAGIWTSLVARNKELRTELQQRNPQMVEFLDSIRNDVLRTSGARQRHGTSLR